MAEHYGLHWFRRDLRVAGNPALQWSLKEHKGQVVGIFCFDPTFLRRSDFGVNRFAFFLRTLRALQSELREIGSDLLVLDEGPDAAFAMLVGKLKKTKSGLPRTVSFNRDYEPFAVARDQRMIRLFQSELDIGVHHERDHMLVEPAEIKKPVEMTPYQIYTPYQRRWLEQFQTSEVQERVAQQKRGIAYLDKLSRGKVERLFALTWPELLDERDIPDTLQHYIDKNPPGVPMPKAGSLAALGALRDFGKRIEGYEVNRDIPGIRGTSQLSIYLKNGSLTVPQAIAELGLKPFKKAKTSADKFLAELVWREFYYYILAKFPDVEKFAFQSRFQKLPWRTDDRLFDAWKRGLTGYPIVDAGMRQLNETGWMHNRVRMVVASFLTKDLQIDYKWGEKYFMEKLIDGDLAPNNGGWQWAASTGCDAQPYFRIFNPELQSRKFDPRGDYIKRWVPELSDCSVKEIHAPVSKSGQRYPAPVVEHRAERDRALAMYAPFVRKA